MRFKPIFSFSIFYKALKRLFSILMAAFMLGISNVILEEERSINDTRARIEQMEVEEEDDDF